ncbi:MAG: hypothetical protein V5A62_08375 [Haloarculaceae archaeon]
MRRSSDEGQVEPTAALAAVFAVCVGLSLYAAVANDAVSNARPAAGPDDTARQAADAVADAARSSGAVVPGRLTGALDAAPSGHRVNATLSTADRRWTAGPTPPERATTARVRVTARVGPADVDPATLRVAVWR